MKKTKLTLFLMFVVGGFIIPSLNSCVSSKKISYFNNIVRDTIVSMPLPANQFTIGKNDLLQISISSPDLTTTALLNSASAVASSGSGTGSGVINGYLVNDNGGVTIPLIGEVKAEGLSKGQLSAKIKQELVGRQIAKDPIVTVRILNYKITVLGEVNRPGVIPVPNEKITLPEALGLAGDLTPYGKRDNILLARLAGDKIVYKRFSLNNDKMFDKEFYYLQNEDVIYVEPNNAKAGLGDRSTQVIPIALSAASLVAVVLTLIIRR